MFCKFKHHKRFKTGWVVHFYCHQCDKSLTSYNGYWEMGYVRMPICNECFNKIFRPKKQRVKDFPKLTYKEFKKRKYS